MSERSWKRALVAGAAVCLVGLTAGCSGDDDGDKDKSDKTSSEGPAIDPKEAKKRTAKTAKCTAEVSTTGAYEAEWDGKATVRTGGKSADDTGPKAVYTLVDGKNRVALYSPGSDFKGSVTLSVGKTAYASDPADARSLEIDPKGRSASVDVTLTSIQGETLELVADFTCEQGKNGKGGKKKQ